MSKRLDATDKKILFLLYTYGKALSRRRIHSLAYEIQNRGVKLGFNFHGSPPISKKLDEKLEKLAERGYLSKLYVAGPLFLNLYKVYYKVTEKGINVAKKGDIGRQDMERIKEIINNIKGVKQALA